MNWAILWEVLGPNSPKYGQILVKLVPEVRFKERNRVVKFFWRIPIFTETTRQQSLIFFFSFYPTLGPIHIYQDKIQPSSYQNIAKSRPYLALCMLLFAPFWLFFGEKGTYPIAVSQFLGTFQSKRFGPSTCQFWSYRL